MGLISLIVTLAIVGMVLYLVESFIPMPSQMRTVIRAVVILVVILWLVQIFIGDVPLPRFRR